MEIVYCCNEIEMIEEYSVFCINDDFERGVSLAAVAATLTQREADLEADLERWNSWQE